MLKFVFILLVFIPDGVMKPNSVGETCSKYECFLLSDYLMHLYLFYFLHANVRSGCHHAKPIRESETNFYGRFYLYITLQI
jgi:hypothetical protein